MTSRVLVVEDNRPLAENIAEILGDSDYEARIVQSAEDALELLHHERFDGIITDLRLPQLSGSELIEELRRRGHTTPVVVVSAFADARDVEKAETVGALDVLPKPVDFDRLFDILAEFAGDNDRVLVLEDSEALADNLAELLREHSLEPIVAASVQAARQQRYLPKLAVVDVRLPDGSGLDAIRTLHARDPKLPILLMTGYPEDLEEVSLPGIEGPIIEKPMDPEVVMARIEAVRSKWHASKR